MRELMRESEAPLPPERVVRRVGVPDTDDVLGWYLGIGRGVRERIEALLGPDWSWEGKRVLDFGCGSGRVLRYFLEEASTVAEFHGCDADGPSIEWLRENLCPPLHALQNGPDRPLPYESRSFDVIWAIAVFPHLFWNWSIGGSVLARLIPRTSRDARALQVERLPRREALVELLRWPRSIGWSEPKPLRAHFAKAALIAAAVPVFRATVPWGPPFHPQLAARLLRATGLTAGGD